MIIICLNLTKFYFTLSYGFFFQCMRKSGMEDTTKAVLPCLLSVLQNTKLYQRDYFTHSKYHLM